MILDNAHLISRPPRKRKLQVANQKRGLRILHCSLLTGTSLDAYLALSIVLAFLCLLQKSLPLLEVLLAGPCPMGCLFLFSAQCLRLLIRYLPLKPETRACENTPRHQANSHPSGRPTSRWFFVFFQKLHPFFYHPPTPFLSCNAKYVENELWPLKAFGPINKIGL